MARRVYVTHLSITLQGDVDERNEVANRAIITARAEAAKRGVLCSISSSEESVHDAPTAPRSPKGESDG